MPIVNSTTVRHVENLTFDNIFLDFCLWEIFWRLWKKLTKKLSFFEDSHGRSLTSNILFWELWIIASYHWMYLLYRKKLRLSNIRLKWYWWYCQKFTNEDNHELPLTSNLSSVSFSQLHAVISFISIPSVIFWTHSNIFDRSASKILRWKLTI